MADQPERLIPKKRPVKYVAEEAEEPEQEEDQQRAGRSDEEDDDLTEDSFDDSDEDEEEEEEDDGKAKDSRRRPKKKRKRNMFIEEEAEVDEDDEDEEFDSEEEDDFVNEAEDAVRLQPQIYRELDQRRDKDQFGDVDDLAAAVKERYGRDAYRSAAPFVGDSSSVPMQFLLPSVKDPNLWLVRCKPGRERDIALNLMRKYRDYAQTDHPLRIKSVVIRDTLKGYVYIEARSQADVQNALDKVNNVYVSKITLVPLEEMVDVMTIKKKETGLKEGSWVRVSRGKYKGDLAQVMHYDNADRVEIRYIPRIDIASRIIGGQGKRKAAARPPQKLFSIKEIPDNVSGISMSNGIWSWGADKFDKYGFLVKEVNLRSLDIENITPTLEEIGKFSIDKEIDPMDIANLELNKESKEQQFALGDTVVVNEGDLLNAVGTVKFIRKGHVVISPRDEELGDIEMEASKLSRLFQVGDHIKVIRGKYQDETGMITQVDGNIVTVFSDATMAQFQVFAKDVRTAAEVSATENQNSSYAVQDLVQLGMSGVGAIVKVERDQYKIIDQTGALRTVKPAEITQRRDSKKAVALDANQFTLHSGDVVEILYGDHQNKQATILHLYRTWAFLHSKDIIENAGIFVVRTKMIRLATAVKNDRPGGAPGFTAQNPGAFKAPAPQLASKRRELLHQTVYITKGSFKGYQGFVKDVTEKGARVQLNTNAKLITIDPIHLRLPNDRSRPNTDSSDRSRYAGAATPAFGSRTPAAWSGAQTPRTGQDGARTPAWDAGARTPAWDAGSRTPANFGYNSDVGTVDGWGTQPSPYVATPAGGIGNTPFAPGTPHAPTPHGTTISGGWGSEPKRPAREYGDEWLLLGLEVKFLKGQFENKVGHVVEVSDGGKTGQVVIENSKVTISAEHLEPVPPAKKDACVFIVGEYKEKKGSLVGFEGNDAIIKLDAGGFKIASMNNVCRLYE